MKNLLFVVVFLFASCFSLLVAQATFGGSPEGLNYSKDQLNNIPSLTFKALDITKLEAEDQNSMANRFAAPIAVDIQPEQHGRWSTLADGTAIWQLKIKVNQAKGLILFYEDFNLAAGDKLFVYTADGEQIKGAYTKASQGKTDRFMTDLTLGDEVIVEYQAPHISNRSPFHIWRIDAAYKSLDQAKGINSTGFGASSDCHDNVECPAGDEWTVERNAVARVIVVVDGGTGFCSGTLMNNTAQDGRLLFLSAFHCMDGYTPLYDLWRFDFYYASPTCENPLMEPEFRSVLGSDSLAGRRANDFLLLDLHPQTAFNMEFHWAGWDRRAHVPDSSTLLHHPLGDIQKISSSVTQASIFTNSINWNNSVTTPPNHHFNVLYNNGTIEPGSSGSALFNQDHRVVGQLQGSGNSTTCDATTGFFARLFMSWEGGGTPASRLKDWLDPLGTTPLTLDPLGVLRAPSILTEDGEAVPDVLVEFFVDDVSYGSSYSDATGRVVVPNGIPANGALRMEFSKGANDLRNGVTTADIIKMQKHILNTEHLSPVKIMACDVNSSNSLTTLDMIRIRKLILAIEANFGEGGVASWQFFRSPFSPENPLQPWTVGDQDNSFSFTIEPGFNLPDFIAVKSGDANGTADLID